MCNVLCLNSQPFWKDLLKFVGIGVVIYDKEHDMAGAGPESFVGGGPTLAQHLLRS